MSLQPLNPRLTMLIEIATNPHRADQEARARLLRLSGAEIDAARAGRCFDVRETAAIRLARAIMEGRGAGIRDAEQKALRLGLSRMEILAIRQLVG